MRRFLTGALILLLSAVMFSRCAFTPQKLYYVFGGLPKDDFLQHKEIKNIYFEKNGSDFAENVAKIYEKDKKQIELTHGFEFRKEHAVFLCVTKECYDKYAIVTGAGAETHYSGDIILNGRKIIAENRVESILTHELSHAIWFENGVGCMPRWWEEGLAVLTSSGGGAEMTSVEEATKSIKAGKVFEPIDASSCRVFFGGDLSKKYGISWSMYYRQSEMFVKFLKERDGAAFKMTLRSLKENKNIYKSIVNSYGKSVQQLWGEWIESVKNSNLSKESNRQNT